jgi:hypothetical protein
VPELPIDDSKPNWRRGSELDDELERGRLRWVAEELVVRVAVGAGVATATTRGFVVGADAVCSARWWRDAVARLVVRCGEDFTTGGSGSSAVAAQ